MESEIFLLVCLELILFTLGITIESLKKYESNGLQRALETFHSAERKKKFLFRLALSDGFALSGLVSHTEDMLGIMTAILYTVHLINICMGIFFATGLLNMFKSETFKIIPLVMGLANLTNTLFSCIVMYSLLSPGQVKAA